MAADRRERSGEADEAQREKGKPSQHDTEYYRMLGKKGGAVLRNKIGPGGFRQLGLKGGAETKQRYGSAFYKTIGQKGGLKKGKRQSEPA